MTETRKEILAWVLQVFSAVALMVGAWFCGNLTDKLDNLLKEVNELKVNVAVMVESQERVRRLETRIINLESSLREHDKIIAVLGARKK